MSNPFPDVQVRDVQRLSLQPGDRLAVLLTDEDVPPEQADHLEQSRRAVAEWAGVDVDRVMFFAGVDELTVVSEQE